MAPLVSSSELASSFCPGFPEHLQHVCGKLVRIKNTFLDDWDTDDLDTGVGHRRSHTIHTWSPAPSPAESERERSPAPTTSDAEELEPQPDRIVAAAHETAFQDLLAWEPSAPLASPTQAGLSVQALDEEIFDTPPFSSSCIGSEPLDLVARRRLRPRGGRKGRAKAATSDTSKEATTETVEAQEKMSGGKKNKLWCHIFIDPSMLQRGFDLTKKIIGKAGANTRNIFDATGAKIRLRGRGSGHFEGYAEADVHLMLAVTTDLGRESDFRRAIEMSQALLDTVVAKWAGFCASEGSAPSRGSLYWVGAVSGLGQAWLPPLPNAKAVIAAAECAPVVAAPGRSFDRRGRRGGAAEAARRLKSDGVAHEAV